MNIRHRQGLMFKLQQILPRGETVWFRSDPLKSILAFLACFIAGILLALSLSKDPTEWAEYWVNIKNNIHWDGSSITKLGGGYAFLFKAVYKLINLLLHSIVIGKSNVFPRIANKR